jgi:hypothetical protein
MEFAVSIAEGGSPTEVFYSLAFQAEEESGASIASKIEIYKSVKDILDYYCTVKVSGFMSKSNRVYGANEFQSLDLAFDMVVHILGNQEDRWLFTTMDGQCLSFAYKLASTTDH